MHTWDEIERFISICGGCPLSLTRRMPVMGRGSHDADIMFIAEAPGETEDKTGIPFTGSSGEVFDRLLGSCGLTRDDIYVTNIVKCHPPGNRNPSAEEKEKCFEYLRYETFLLRPRIIVCMGRVAAQMIISPDFRITRQHGTWIRRKNCMITAVYHPSAILRDPSKAADTEQDYIRIAEMSSRLSSR